MLRTSLAQTPWLKLLLLGLVWGSAFTAIKNTVGHGFDPFTLTAVRLTLATLTILPFVLVKFGRKAFIHKRNDYLHLFIISVCGLSLPFVLVAWSIEKIASSVAAILNSTMPLFTLILSLVILGNKLSPIKLGGVVIGFFGVIVLVGIPDFKTDPYILYRYAVCICASLFYALATVWVKHRLQSFEAYQLTFWQLLISSVISWIVVLFTPTHPFDLITIGSILSITYLGTICSAFALTLYFTLIETDGPTYASTVTYLIPLFSVFIGWMFFDETISLQLICGMSVILFGVFLTGRARKLPSGAEYR